MFIATVGERRLLSTHVLPTVWTMPPSGTPPAAASSRSTHAEWRTIAAADEAIGCVHGRSVTARLTHSRSNNLGVTRCAPKRSATRCCRNADALIRTPSTLSASALTWNVAWWPFAETVTGANACSKWPSATACTTVSAYAGFVSCAGQSKGDSGGRCGVSSDRRRPKGRRPIRWPRDRRPRPSGTQRRAKKRGAQ